MTIRKAILEDAQCIATYLLLAMDTIVYEFIGTDDAQKANDFLLHFIQKENNQYSYQNCWVVEDNKKIIAAVNIYDGGKLKQLRNPIAEYIQKELKRNFNPEDETQAGEQYIDTLGVHPDFQGKGIGANLLQFLIDKYVIQNNESLGLLVEDDNLNAKRLYIKLGFAPVGKKILVGKSMWHLQIKR